MSKVELDYDLIVVGAGSAGYAAATMAGRAGLKTAIVDGAEEVGGLCILRGCMPTKSLLHVAEVAHQVRHASRFGILAGEMKIDFPAIMARKDRLIGDFAQYRRKQLASGPFEFIRAEARFRDPHRLELSDGRVVSAHSFILATGSQIAPSPLPDLEQVGYLTSDDALELKELPRSLIVLGGGAVAVEFAQFFSRLGVKVSLIQRSPHLMKEFDSDAAEVLEQVFRQEGIELITNTKLESVSRDGDRKVVAFHCRGQLLRIAADEILYALGRIPNTAGLGLEAAGVETEGPRILTNCEMQTNVPHIFAAGDARGRHEIVHFAIQQAEIAVTNILNPTHRASLDYRLLTTIIFTDPQLAKVGLGEKDAADAGTPVKVARYPFADHGKALIMGATEGFVKLLADPKSGEIVGGAVAGHLGGELLHEIVAAISKRMTVHELSRMPHYHPTLAEIWTYPAEELASLIAEPF